MERNSLTALDRAEQGSGVARQASEYADRYTKNQGYLSVYSHGNIKAKKANPFEGSQPFAMDGAQFIYWCFDYAGVELLGGSEHVNVKKIRKDPRFTVIYSEGQKHKGILNNLRLGDLLFFGSDTSHVGIFCGACNFISINGSGDWDASQGIQVNDITSDYWWGAFNGAVIRWE